MGFWNRQKKGVEAEAERDEEVSAIVSTTRETDRVSRFGGEEFLTMLPDTDRIGAMVQPRKSVLLSNGNRGPPEITMPCNAHIPKNRVN